MVENIEITKFTKTNINEPITAEPNKFIAQLFQ